MTISRRITTALAAALSVASIATFSATAADAAPPQDGTIGLTFDADTTTVIAKTRQPVVFPKTSLVTRTNLQTVTGTLNLPQANADLTLGSLTIASFQISIIDASPVTGTITRSGTDEAPNLDLDVSQSFRIRLDRVQPLGISTGSADLNLIPAGGGCATAPTTAKLAGSLDAIKLLQQNQADTHVKGSYTIPPFQGNCGAFVGILNGIIAGPGNTLDVHLTNVVFPDQQQSALRAALAN